MFQQILLRHGLGARVRQLFDGADRQCGLDERHHPHQRHALHGVFGCRARQRCERGDRRLTGELRTGNANGKLRMALCLSKPVFVHGVAPDPARLATRLDPDRAIVTLIDEGGCRTRVQASTFTLPDGRHIAGAQRRWSLAAPPPGSHPVSAVALTDLRPVNVPVVKLP